MAHALDPAAGAIYDIGYRNYEGARLGRGYAFRTLYAHSLRTAFGLGRGGRALFIPWALFGIMMLPGIVTVAVAGITGGMMNTVIDYHRIFPWDAMFLALFCAAQAPEMVSTDQHSRVLPLYFSRALRRHDYAAAKLLAMWTTVFILILTPLLIILLGRLALPADFGAAFRAESRNFAGIVLTPVVAAVVMGTLALALSSLMTRRWIASALVLGTFLLTAPVAEIIENVVDEKWSGYRLLINPILTANGAMLALFGKAPAGADATLPPAAFAAGVAAYGLLFSAILFNRYRRLST
jgi:ABC-2 type transport system permease protein